MDGGPFELSYIEQTDRPVRWVLRFGYIILDAVFYTAGLFLCLEAALLRVENVSSLTHTVSVVVLFVAFMFLSRSIYVKLFRAPLFFGLVLEFLALFLIVVGAAWLALGDPDSSNFAWLPWRCHRLPDMLLLFLRLSPLLAAWLALGFLLLTAQVARRRPRFPLLMTASLAALLLIQYTLIMGRGARPLEILGILVLFAFPFQAALRGRPRLFARTLLVFLVASFMIWHLLGLTPVSHQKPFAGLPGVVHQYPAPEKEDTLPPALVSDIEPCPAGGLLYVAGGRSGKLLGLDIGTGGIIRTTVPGSNFFRIAADPWNQNIYALDTANADVFQFSPGSLHGISRHSVRTDWGFTPNNIIPSDTSAYLSYSELPGVAEFSVEKFQEEGGVRLGNLYTPYRTGAWALAMVKETRGIYVIAGAPGPGRGALILFIDPVSFKPVSSGIIPDAGPALAAAPGGAKIYSTSFFRENIYEIAANGLKVSRILPGPSASRALAYDPKRNLLYAGGYYDGRLMAVDTASGRVVSSHFACNRIVSLKLDERTDRLWLACIKGIYRINLPEYLGEVPPESAPVQQPHGKVIEFFP